MKKRNWVGVPQINYTGSGRNYRLRNSQYAGSSVFHKVDLITDIIDYIRIDPGHEIRLLDYGCGRGFQYSENRFHEVEWRVQKPYCYDPNVPEFSQKPPKTSFDGIICTDVLQQLEGQELDSTIEELFSYLDYTLSRQFIFISVSCRFAKNFRKDGRNVNLTLQPPEWWLNRISHWKIKGVRVIMHCS